MPHEFRADPKAKRLLPLQVEAPDIEEWLLARDPTAIGAWNELGPEEYARSFTAARTAGADVADDLYFALVDTFARSGTEADFVGMVEPILRAKGWLEGDQGQIAERVRLIYDTNLRLARAAGRWTAYNESKDALPYLRAFTVGDFRVRRPPKSEADHTAWEGIILPIGHWFWRVYWPPLGFRCRCEVAQMTRSQFLRSGGLVTSDAELEQRIAEIGPPIFLAPGVPIANHLEAMVARSNAKQMPGLPKVNTAQTLREGGDAFDAVLRASSLKDIGRQLAAMGFG
jgi:hypothetical protein